MFVGDGDRERVSAALREHYARGRLTLEEFSHRIDLVLAARSHHELRRALSGLPALPEVEDLVRRARTVVGAAGHAAALVVFTGAYLLFSLVLLFVLALVVLLHGASASALAAFLVVWLVPTYLLSRLWHRTPSQRRPGT